MDVFVPAVGHAHDGRQGDHAALAAFPHRRRRGPDDPHDAAQVDVERLLPFLVGKVRQRDLVGDAGIGEDDVDRSMGRLDRRHDGIRPGGVADVQAMKLRLSAGSRDLLGSLTAFIVEDVGQDDAVPGIGEGLGRSPADPDAGSGDQYDRHHG